MAEPEGPPSPAFVAAAFAVVLLTTVLLTLWGAVLVPFRVAGVLVPVSLLLAAGNVVLVLAGGRLLGRLGAALPGVLWLALALVLAGKRTEGDLLLPTAYGGTGLVGLGYLLVGAMASAMTYGFVSARIRVAEAAVPGAASPRGAARR